MSEYKNIVVYRNSSLARVTINRPPLNVLNIETMLEIGSAIKEINKLKDVKCVIVTGSGSKAFSAGVDVGDHSRDFVSRMLSSFHGMINSIMELDKIVVAAINGMALGGGMELAVACDLAIAVDSARLGQPEIKLGVFATFANVILPRLTSRKKAMEILLLGETITAAKAESIGLVTRAVPANKFETTVEEVVKQFDALSASSLKWCKRSIYAGFDLSFADALARAEKIYIDDLMDTADANEGVRSFLEKRQPTWKNE